MKKIEIVITNNDGSTSVLASNTDQNADPQKDLAPPLGPRVWRIAIDSAVLRTLSTSDHWAASFLCKRAMTEMFMVPPEDVAGIAMLAAFHASQERSATEAHLTSFGRTLKDVVKALTPRPQ